MKYLRKFATEADASVVAKPNVVLFADTNEVRYNFTKLGVFIQHINGNLFTTDQWSANGFSNDDANGIAVVSDKASFVISKDASVSYSRWASTSSTAIDGAMLTESSDIAKTDYNGKGNTEAAAAYDTSYAIYACNNYTFPNGAKGYLPALGELQIAWENREAIESAITLLGGYFMSSTYWSSTQYNASKVWTINWNSGSFSTMAKGGALGGGSYYIRPFGVLNI